ncbi:LON peptidase N-terminal domain and RING finger protein 3-like [Mizuhopecten yessoensis]|uniref:LON peptidase N-terminal domain and RING finger protein 1 n=1 Tax=Mizuhopecten yessoensis TaxID=6573 RepID=A0A210QYC7_MIZYE|nr:LON peptidase N-terminal domain and RING finger protein 3-like [Mizuhopecten yessoensis]OWF53763.1 LON peptidase N-terminal domain and RING finger protein 1 [Mizuhopecten yessoensis]
MVDLARQAFNTNNFELAVDVYERTIREHGPSSDLYFGLADSFARSGQFERAFESYCSAFRLTNSIRPGVLKHLVTALVEAVKQDSVVEDAMMNKNCIFTCVLCRGLLSDPVTIPCGHTFCRKCVERDQSKICKRCGKANHFVNVSSIKTNVLLKQVIDVWFPSECEALRLKSEGNIFFERREFEKAINLYNKAILLAPNDHLLLSNRSHAYASLDKYEEALRDGELVIRLRPDWPKGYFRKGCALYGLGRYGDAVVVLLQCLAMDPTIILAKNYLSKALHKILSPLPSNDPKAGVISSHLSPAKLQQLIMSNFSSAILQPDIAMDTIMTLKNIITETVTTATSFAVTNQEHMPLFEFKPDMHESGPSSAKGQAAAGWQEEAEKGSHYSSAPNSRSGSPFLEQRRSRSQSPPCQGHKRTRNTSGATPTSPFQESPFKLHKNDPKLPIDAVEIKPELLNQEDFECSLCYRLLYEPVTTPCGHAFCRHCLDRCLDHQSQCPLCKSSLVEYLAERRQTITENIAGIVETYFRQELEQRRKTHEDEMEELSRMVTDQHEIPVFVCTMAFPGIPCPLHIFEPRYRLMVRQCMESGTRQFGMCTGNGDSEQGFSEFGCMLEIRDVQFFPDGRSLVDTIGGKRFKVISQGHKDGYDTAKVEFLTDQPISEVDHPRISVLQTEVYGLAKSWLDKLTGMQREQILRHLGQFPGLEQDFHNNPNGSAWLWWTLSVLPLDTRIQMTMLAMRSYEERLNGIKRILMYMQRQR